ncbi:hypothetical protein [Kitasatospora azatica]|uniref:hypothetical protein n=1 Tax=Kitasatospora azatica TaxID=58347 RepID=UPI00056A28CF|nr:hypothetical protein [Kitasatospora azatica]
MNTTGDTTIHVAVDRISAQIYNDGHLGGTWAGLPRDAADILDQVERWVALSGYTPAGSWQRPDPARDLLILPLTTNTTS